MDRNGGTLQIERIHRTPDREKPQVCFKSLYYSRPWTRIAGTHSNCPNHDGLRDTRTMDRDNRALWTVSQNTWNTSKQSKPRNAPGRHVMGRNGGMHLVTKTIKRAPEV
ncbi:hypothetical protein QAD02_009718 [Eretmocerus hayati]|uniref:Uncharacterized protein n=1 Tax=Eretmocerus hayati TaxID=131215 RepID=A0ACC2NEM5_9HYME|nr:hypothetical protein QAD02_009718 [Eretmocerus hayati]